jgi:DNA repair protein RecO (recombination protein O)
MYAIHTTPGFILDSRPYGDADKLLTIFTRDFGLITATALGIRFEKSKLRYFCQDYSFSTFSLVRGKEFWRLTSAAAADTAMPSSAAADVLIARLAQLLRRLLHGEEENAGLFDTIQSTAYFLADASAALTEEDLKALESVTVLRVLALLGYIGSDPAIQPYLANGELSVDLLKQAAAQRTALNQHINKALKESHL